MAENKNAQQVREITDKLEQGIKDLFESERFKEYLRTMFLQQHAAHCDAEAGGNLCCRLYLVAAQL